MRMLALALLVACSDVPSTPSSGASGASGAQVEAGIGADAANTPDASRTMDANAEPQDASSVDAGSKACGMLTCSGGAACCSENQGNGILVCRAPRCNTAAGGDAVIECTSPTDCSKPQVCCAVFAPGAIGRAFTTFSCTAPENCSDETGWSVCTTQDDCPSPIYRCKKLDMNSPVSWCMPTF